MSAHADSESGRLAAAEATQTAGGSPSSLRIILNDRLQSVFVARPLRCASLPGEVRLLSAGPFLSVAILIVFVHVAFGGAAAFITLKLAPSSLRLAITLALVFACMGAGLSLLYWKGSPREKVVAVYDIDRKRVQVPALQLDEPREAIAGIEYRVSRVTDDSGGANRMEPHFAQLILTCTGQGGNSGEAVSTHVAACTFGTGTVNTRAAQAFASAIGCPYRFVRIRPDHRITRSELRSVITELL